MIQLLPGIRIKEPFRHSTYGRVKVKTIQLFLGKHKFVILLLVTLLLFPVFEKFKKKTILIYNIYIIYKY